MLIQIDSLVKLNHNGVVDEVRLWSYSIGVRMINSNTKAKLLEYFSNKINNEVCWTTPVIIKKKKNNNKTEIEQK